MDKARINSQKAIERMYDAERDAEEARLEAAKAKASLGAVRKATEVENFASSEAKKDIKEARRRRKEIWVLPGRGARVWAARKHLEGANRKIKSREEFRDFCPF